MRQFMSGLRPHVLGICLLSLTAALGCQPFKFGASNLTPVPVAFTTTPAANDLFTVVNERTARVRQLQAEANVGITGVPAKLSGSLILERPNRLRLKVNPLGMESLGADIGSNDQSFWVWAKSGGVMAESVLMYANHREYQQSPVASVMPLDPRWVTDALGLIEFDRNLSYQGPTERPDGRWEIRAVEMTGRGPQASIMIFEPRTGLLKQKSLYDSQGNLIGYCDIGPYQYFTAEQVAIPTEMKFYFRPGTAMESTATIQLSNVRLNGLYVDPITAWEMPNPVGVPRVDLSRTPLTNPAFAPNSPATLPANTPQPKSWNIRGASLPFQRSMNR